MNDFGYTLQGRSRKGFSLCNALYTQACTKNIRIYIFYNLQAYENENVQKLGHFCLQYII